MSDTDSGILTPIVANADLSLAMPLKYIFGPDINKSFQISINFSVLITGNL